MTTIQERALTQRASFSDNCYICSSEESYSAYYDGYVDGATEQRQIDIEKVYHALEKVLSNEMLDNIRKILEEES